MNMNKAPDSFQGSDAHRNLISGVVDPIRAELEATRGKWQRIGTISRIVLAVTTLACLAKVGMDYMATGTFEQVSAPFLTGSLLSVVATFIVPGWLLKKGLGGFKDKIVPAILGHFGDFQYDPNPARNTFFDMRAMGLLPDFDRGENEDYIFGTYRDQKLSIIQLKLTREEVAHDEDNSTTTHEVFNGVLLKVKNPRKLEGSYSLMPQLTAKRGFSFGNPHGRQRIKLESDLFEKEYDLFGTDQIEGRVLFTPKMIERWHQLATRKGIHGVAAVFEDGHVHMAVHRKADFIDAAMLSSNKESIDNQVAAMAEDIEGLLKAVDTLIFLD